MYVILSVSTILNQQKFIFYSYYVSSMGQWRNFSHSPFLRTLVDLVYILTHTTAMARTEKSELWGSFLSDSKF